MNISAVVLTKNNSDNIGSIHDSLKTLDEIIVVDDRSTDDTKLLCRKYGLKYYERPLDNNFSAQRNFALSKCRNDWVFFLDSDEEVSKDFIYEAKKEINRGKYNGFYIKRKNIFINLIVTGTEMGNQKIIRLGNKIFGMWKRRVHEYWDIKGNIGMLEGEIVHNTAVTLYSFIDKIGRYFTIHGEENISKGKSPYFFYTLILPILKFIQNFFYLKGYKDNVHGFVISIFMSFHSFLSWSHIWLNRENN